MKPFQSQLLRFCPHPFPGEVLVVGLVAYDPVESQLTFRSMLDESRVAAVFGPRMIEGVKVTLDALEVEFEEEATKLKSAEVMTLGTEGGVDIREITTRVLPPNDTALQFSSVYEALGPPRGYRSFEVYTEDLISQMTRYKVGMCDDTHSSSGQSLSPNRRVIPIVKIEVAEPRTNAESFIGVLASAEKRRSGGEVATTDKHTVIDEKRRIPGGSIADDKPAQSPKRGSHLGLGRGVEKRGKRGSSKA